MDIPARQIAGGISVSIILQIYIYQLFLTAQWQQRISLQASQFTTSMPVLTSPVLIARLVTCQPTTIVQLSVTRKSLYSFAVCFRSFLKPFQVIQRTPQIIIQIRIGRAVLYRQPISRDFSLVISCFILRYTQVYIGINVLWIKFYYFIIIINRTCIITYI